VDILLDNAQKYSEPGTVRLTLRRAGRTGELTVSNPFPELSKAECRDVFKRFYRRDEARTQSGSYGLGLPIAEGIVKLHGGKISCAWEAGFVRFTVTLPLLS
jgi:signal transduction histidine kinase